MRTILHVLVILFIMTVLMTGCSTGGDDALAPKAPTDIRSTTDNGNSTTGLWGLWQVTIDRNTGEFDITKTREADLALNVLGFLEPPALVNLNIDFATLDLDFVNNTIGVDVILTHPFITPDKVFNGFDVRGIVFGPWVDNADGLTRYMNPDEFSGLPFGYVDGLLGAPDSSANYTKHFNGYKYFANGITPVETVPSYYAKPANLTNRGMFTEGGVIKRHYDLQFGGGYTAMLVFNYAVCASYNWPTGTPPFDLSSFDVTTANQAEPVFLDASETYNTLFWDTETASGGGSINLDLSIFDWVKPTNPETITMEVPGVIPSTSAVFQSDDDIHTRSYTVAANASPKAAGELDILVHVTTEKTYGQNFFLDLLPTSHPLFSTPIETIFVYKSTVIELGALNLPYNDPMGPGTVANWTIENGPGHSATMQWGNVGPYWASNGLAVGTDYEDNMDTTLVTPLFMVPSTGAFTLLLTHVFGPEQNSDFCNIVVREGLAGSWQPLSASGSGLTGTCTWWPTWQEKTYVSTATLVPGHTFQVGFQFTSDTSLSTFDPWFIDNVYIIANRPPVVGAVSGNASPGMGISQYSIDPAAYDPDGNSLTYAWEIGDDIPPAYNDGPGNGDGTIDIDFTTPGSRLVGCKVTDNGSPNLSDLATPLTVTIGNIDGFDNFEEPWPPPGWSFWDWTGPPYCGTAYGQTWGKATYQGKGCLSAAGDLCYGNHLWEEARWEAIVIPAAANANLIITHAMDCHLNDADGGSLWIDGINLGFSYWISGYKNNGYNYNWECNNYTDVIFSPYLWKGENPYPWDSGFATTIMDISNWADGQPHDISFCFASDNAMSCESGSPYNDWVIDEVQVVTY